MTHPLLIRVLTLPGSALPSGHGQDLSDTARVREWAKEQGIEIKDRGRVPATVVEKYLATAGA
jgi:Lsr2